MQLGQQAADFDHLEEEAGDRVGLQHLAALGGDGAGAGVEGDAFALDDLLAAGACEQQQPEVEGVAEEQARERRRDDGGDAGGL